MDHAHDHGAGREAPRLLSPILASASSSVSVVLHSLRPARRRRRDPG